MLRSQTGKSDRPSPVLRPGKSAVGQEPIEHTSQSVYIRSNVTLLSRLLLRSREARCTKAAGIGSRGGLKLRAMPKSIRRTRPSRSIITLDGFRSLWMMELLAMQIGERIAKLQSDGCCFRCRQAAATLTQSLLQRHPVNIIHDEHLSSLTSQDNNPLAEAGEDDRFS